MVLGVPIIRLIYQHGRFTAADTLPTASALFLYSFGLVGYTGVKVLAPAFYALGRSRLPLVGSLLAVGTNLLIGLAGLPALRLSGRSRPGRRSARSSTRCFCFGGFRAAGRAGCAATGWSADRAHGRSRQR